LEQQVDDSVANPGLVRPPLVFALAVAVGILLNFNFPLTLSLGYIAKVATFGFLFAGVALFFWTRSVFKEVGTAISGNKPATSLLQDGPFRFSRNPMYVAFTLLYLSAASWLENLWAFGTLIAALWVISKIVVPREERFMKAKFGVEYEAFASRTRRWI
jgi:protein-S-isoprenylcysteine O-methyltransferase Ste14